MTEMSPMNYSHRHATNNVLTLAATAPKEFFRLAPEVDASTMTGKLLMGSQRWFACPDDGSASSIWFHRFRSHAASEANKLVKKSSASLECALFTSLCVGWLASLAV